MRTIFIAVESYGVDAFYYLLKPIREGDLFPVLDRLLRQLRRREDSLPVTAEAGHGYGCRSIRAIVLQHGGLYTFSPEKGVFTLQIALPLLPM